MQSNAETPCSVAYSDYPGYGGKLKYRSLWTNKDESNGQATCTLLIAEKGVIIPQHVHPEGEFLFVIEGSVVIESTYPNRQRATVRYKKGDSVWVPANTIHHREISEGVKVIVFEPKPSVKF